MQPTTLATQLPSSHVAAATKLRASASVQPSTQQLPSSTVALAT